MADQASTVNICYDYEPYSKEDLLERCKILANHDKQKFIDKYLISVKETRKLQDLTKDELENIYQQVIEDITQDYQRLELEVLAANVNLYEMSKNNHC